MAAQPLPLSLEDFPRLYDGAKPTYEYWSGAAIQKSMPTVLHGIVQAILILLLEKAGWNAASQVRLKIISDAEPVPDVIAMRGKFSGRYPTAAPELCIEIMSPSDALPRALEKAARCIAWGTQMFGSSIRRSAQRGASQSRMVPSLFGISPQGTLRIAETAISLPDLFPAVDQKWESTAPAPD